MEAGLINIIERVGSLGLLGWLLVWATGTAWPKVSAHLDAMTTKLDRIGDQLAELHSEVAQLNMRVGAGPVPARPAPAARADTGSAPTQPRHLKRATGGSKA